MHLMYVFFAKFHLALSSLVVQQYKLNEKETVLIQYQVFKEEDKSRCLWQFCAACQKISAAKFHLWIFNFLNLSSWWPNLECPSNSITRYSLCFYNWLCVEELTKITHLKNFTGGTLNKMVGSDSVKTQIAGIAI